jgi:lipopolysaccharide export LptBFGC system permease protein LptF
MALLGALELLFVVLVVGLLFLLSVRVQRQGRLNVLPSVIIGLLLLGVFSLSKLLLTYVAITLILALMVAVLVAFAALRLTHR